MRIGILITSIANFGEKGFYNSQEVGLAKELDKLYDEVIVYKADSNKEFKKTISIDGTKNTRIEMLPCKNFGINGIVNIKHLDKTIDQLIYFSDTQITVPMVYRWCSKNNIKITPYIGVVSSHSTNMIIRYIINTLFSRNLKVYKKCHCLVKTPAVKEALSQKGVKNITLAPVGLDLSVVKKDYSKYSVSDMKKKHGYTDEEKVILFIGRLVEEKQPLRMIDIFSQLYTYDKKYRLLMIGTGHLKDSVVKSIKECTLSSVVKMIDKIPNSEIWELYRIADTFVNLNQQEIFGMGILEAMYYECKVVAWRAPGPEYIIEDGVSGCLADSNQEAIKKIVESNNLSVASHETIIENFTWVITAEKIYKLCCEG